MKGFWLAALFGLVGLAFGGIAIIRDSTEVRGTRVLLFMSTDCPVAQSYSPRIQKLVETFAPREVEFEAVFPNEAESTSGIESYLAERHLNVPYSIDFGAERAKKLGIKIVPTVVIVDATGKVLYKGAIDDNKDASIVKRSYLSETLSSILAGSKPKLASTEPFGCLIMPSKTLPPIGKVTFASHVGKIVYDHCSRCHHQGEAAPFNLTSYADAKKWAPNIAAVTKKRSMPPWKAVPGHGEFSDVNRLTDEEIELIARWADSGSPRGDVKQEPKAPTYASGGWMNGKPDLILKPDREFTLGADGSDVYREFVIDPGLKETVYVTAMDVRPGNRKVVHHVIAWLDSYGLSAQAAKRTNDGQPGYNGSGGGPGFIPGGALGGWAPGQSVKRLPEGVGFELKPTDKLVLEIHYHKNGKVEKDQTEIGLYFSRKPAQRLVNIAWLVNLGIYIKAGQADQTFKRSFRVGEESVCYGIMPHMHYLGRSMKAWVEMPDGTTKPMVYIKDWDFNWQMTYSFKEPLVIPKGSKIWVEAVYDNSEANPNNPNSPPKDVRWGEQTTDEMFLLVALVAPLQPKGRANMQTFMR